MASTEQEARRQAASPRVGAPAWIPCHSHVLSSTTPSPSYPRRGSNGGLVRARSKRPRKELGGRQLVRGFEPLCGYNRRMHVRAGALAVGLGGDSVAKGADAREDVRADAKVAHPLEERLRLPTRGLTRRTLVREDVASKEWRPQGA